MATQAFQALKDSVNIALLEINRSTSVDFDFQMEHQVYQAVEVHSLANEGNDEETVWNAFF